MILVDTSVWVDHFRKSNQTLCSLLQEDQIQIHPFIIGELACGRLRRRDEILSSLHDLPQTPSATLEEVLYFIQARQLYRKGLGLIDVHLLISAFLSGSVVWTLDRALTKQAARLGMDYQINSPS